MNFFTDAFVLYTKIFFLNWRNLLVLSFEPTDVEAAGVNIDTEQQQQQTEDDTDDDLYEDDIFQKDEISEETNKDASNEDDIEEGSKDDIEEGSKDDTEDDYSPEVAEPSDLPGYQPAAEGDISVYNPGNISHHEISIFF